MLAPIPWSFRRGHPQVPAVSMKSSGRPLANRGASRGE